MSKSINPKFIKEFIGYSDIKTTMRYIRPTDKYFLIYLVSYSFLKLWIS